MRLQSVEVQDFRNIETADLSPGEHATVVVGPNGQGKTNLLEALYLLATLRPLRTNRYAELVRFGATRARVCGRFALGGAQRTIAVEVDAKGREASVDGKPVRALAEYFGGVSVVAFTPDDLAVLKGGPDGRRRLLDRATFNRFPGHLEAARDYQRALKQRNRLLKEGAPFDLIDAYNETLARTGARVVVRRRALVSELAPRSAQSFAAIAQGDGALSIAYDPDGVPAEALADEQATFEALLALVRRRTASDLERGFTSAGPHADDLDIELGGRPAKGFASQGQQRAIVLALKIGEIENLRATAGVPPLLLLDDVSSELDPSRNAYLMQYLRACGLQVFLTTTDERLVRQAAGDDARCFSVERGSFGPKSP
ncbi:MAG: DNA replication/repair protein RecF [Deltaproteobacteria bacterium]|nr:DNA replication/repair protein RecF [Deltaproteobacteria bacterium]